MCCYGSIYIEAVNLDTDYSLLCFSSLFEALAAVHGSVVGRLECYLCNSAALSTSGRKVLTGSLTGVLLRISAGLVVTTSFSSYIAFPRFVKIGIFARRRILPPSP